MVMKALRVLKVQRETEDQRAPKGLQDLKDPRGLREMMAL